MAHTPDHYDHIREHGVNVQPVVHACPEGDSGFTPCCDRTPFELDPWSRMTIDPSLVTCGRTS